MVLRGSLLALSIGMIGCGNNTQPVKKENPPKSEPVQEKSVSERDLEKRQLLFLNGEWTYTNGTEKRIIEFVNPNSDSSFFEYCEVDGEQLFRRRGWFILTQGELYLHVMKRHKNEVPAVSVKYKVIKFDVPSDVKDVKYLKDVIEKGPKTIELELDGKKFTLNRVVNG